MKRIFCGLLCAAALLLTACGQKTAAQAEAAADPAVAAAQLRMFPGADEPVRMQRLRHQAGQRSMVLR